MKAKDYFQKLKTEYSHDYQSGIVMVFRDMFREVEEIRKQRNAKYDASVIAIMNEQNLKFDAFIKMVNKELNKHYVIGIFKVFINI